MRHNNLPSRKELAGLKHTRKKSADGTIEENYVLSWKDGSETEYPSMEALPSRYQKVVRQLEKKSVSQIDRFNTSPISHSSSNKKQRRGSRFGVHWCAEPDKLVVRWPTVDCAGLFSVMLVFLAILLVIDLFFPFTSWSDTPVVSLVLAVLCGLLAACAFGSVYILEERFELHSNRVFSTRWPAFFRPGRVRPRKDVINARLVLRRPVGKNRQTSSVYVRVRTPNGTDWWEVGGSLSRSEASRVGEVLRQYMELDKEDHQSDDLALHITL